jgi:hypothetical protein
LSQAPPRFRELREGSRYLLVEASLERDARELGLLAEGGIERLLAAAGPAGRGATSVVELPRRQLRLHLRPVRHGGLLAGLLGGWFLTLSRPRAELHTAATLAARSAPVARTVLVAARRELLWRAVVGSIYEESMRDGLELLASGPSPARIQRAAAAVGGALRAFHDAGGSHADLHLKNLLLREGPTGVEVRLIDLDRGRASTPPDARRRMREIMRLYRSLRKRALHERVGARGCARFLGAYTAGDRALRRALRAQLPRERRRLAVHALAYRNAAPAPGTRPLS